MQAAKVEQIVPADLPGKHFDGPREAHRVQQGHLTHTTIPVQLCSGSSVLQVFVCTSALFSPAMLCSCCLLLVQVLSMSDLIVPSTRHRQPDITNWHLCRCCFELPGGCFRLVVINVVMQGRRSRLAATPLATAAAADAAFITVPVAYISHFKPGLAFQQQHARNRLLN